MKGKYFLLLIAGVMVSGLPAFAQAEDAPQFLSNNELQQGPASPYVSEFELESQLSQIHSELRSQRDLADLRMNTLENEIKVSSSYVERLLFAFMIAGGIVVFVVLVTLNKQSNVNNERMRNLIREAESALDDLHRLMDRPETEHFHVSRKLSRVMNKLREKENPSLPQKEISDIYAASEDPTLPVSLHLQANALRSEQRGDWTNAIHLWEKLLSIDETSPEVLLHLAQNYKRLAQVSSGDQASKLREASLDYFQKYSVRTNLHTHSERELRRMSSLGMSQGAVSQLTSTSDPISEPQPAQQLQTTTQQHEVEAAAPIAKPAEPVQPQNLNLQGYGTVKKSKKKLTPGRRKSVTESLLAINSTATMQKPPAKQEAQPAAAGDAGNGSGVNKPSPVTENEVQKVKVKSNPKPKVVKAKTKAKQQATATSQQGNGEAKAAKDQLSKDKQEVASQDKETLTAATTPELPKKGQEEPAKKAQEEPAKKGQEEPVKKAQEEPAKKGQEEPAKKAQEEPAKKVKAPSIEKSVPSKQSAVMSANGNSSNGSVSNASKAEADASGQVDGHQSKAYKSRMDKAKEYFGRYGAAKTKKDKMAWLHGAIDEFKMASKYSTEYEMYRLWGMTVIEMATVDSGNERDHVKVAIEVFTSALKHHNGACWNELSLCHAILGDESSCRDALEKARKNGTLDPDFYANIPYYDKYKGTPWFEDLSKT